MSNKCEDLLPPFSLAAPEALRQRGGGRRDRSLPPTCLLVPSYLSHWLFFRGSFPLVNAEGIWSFGGLQQTVFLMSCSHSGSALLSHFSCFSLQAPNSPATTVKPQRD